MVFLAAVAILAIVATVDAVTPYEFGVLVIGEAQPRPFKIKS
jgi:hypothetical protein